MKAEKASHGRTLHRIKYYPRKSSQAHDGRGPRVPLCDGLGILMIVLKEEICRRNCPTDEEASTRAPKCDYKNKCAEAVSSDKSEAAYTSPVSDTFELVGVLIALGFERALREGEHSTQPYRWLLLSLQTQ